jgi:hypothetical protein
MRLWIGFREDYYTLLVSLLHALRMQTSTKLLGSPNPFIFYFLIKLIGADHGLRTFGSLQIS